MDKAKQKKINNNNRKRGGAFEKRVADFLDMDVVPYSGSNSRYGYGDVRDSKWLGECKNITPVDDKITIKMDWLTKNEERASAINHMSYLAWMPAGKADKYVMVDHNIMAKIGITVDDVVTLETKHNTKNIIVHLNANYVGRVRKGNVICLISGMDIWYMMNISVFKELITKYGLKGERSTI